MWWKFFVGLVFGLLCGSFGMAHLFLAAHDRGVSLSPGDSHYSSQKFGSLSAEEINRRTLKAAAAIESAQRRY